MIAASLFLLSHLCAWNVEYREVRCLHQPLHLYQCPCCYGNKLRKVTNVKDKASGWKSKTNRTIRPTLTNRIVPNEVLSPVSIDLWLFFRSIMTSGQNSANKLFTYVDDTWVKMNTDDTEAFSNPIISLDPPINYWTLSHCRTATSWTHARSHHESTQLRQNPPQFYHVSIIEHVCQ